MSMPTIYDVLEAPGYAYGTSSTASKSTSSRGLGFSLLMAASGQQQRSLPSSLVYEHDMVTDLYRNEKQGLLLEVGQLEADQNLSARAQIRRHNGQQLRPKHYDEGSAVQMDWDDFVEPAVAAACQILSHRRVDAGLRLDARSAQPAIVTSIKVHPEDDARARRIVIFEHEASYLASNVLESLHLLASLAQNGADLD